MSKRETDAKVILVNFVNHPTPETWEEVHKYWEIQNACPFNIMYEGRCGCCPFTRFGKNLHLSMHDSAFEHLCPFYKNTHLDLSSRLVASIQAVAYIETYENLEIEQLVPLWTREINKGGG